MKFGAEPKRLAVLAGLLVVAGVVWYVNSSGPEQPPSAPRRPAPVAAPETAPAKAPAPNIQRPVSRPARSQAARGTVQDFKPSLKPKKPEERVDPTTIDPTLRLDLLAKLHSVTIAGGERSLFDFAQPPVAKKPDVKITPGPVKPADGTKVAEAKKPDTPAPKPLIPIPLKFYGFSNPPKPGVKRAFFLEGDEIYVAAEGEIVKRRYKIVRIGVNSVVVEDVEQKNQQTLPLVEEQPS